MEAFNARVPYPAANEQAAAFAIAHTLPGVASSDAHSLLEVGIAYNVLRGPIDTAGQLKAALVDLSLVMQRGSYAARSFTPLAKLINRFRGNRRIRPVVRTAPPGQRLP